MKSRFILQLIFRVKTAEIKQLPRAEVRGPEYYNQTGLSLNLILAEARQFYKQLVRELKHAVITSEKWRLPAGRQVNKVDPGGDERTYFVSAVYFFTGELNYYNRTRL